MKKFLIFILISIIIVMGFYIKKQQTEYEEIIELKQSAITSWQNEYREAVAKQSEYYDNGYHKGFVDGANKAYEFDWEHINGRMITIDDYKSFCENANYDAQHTRKTYEDSLIANINFHFAFSKVNRNGEYLYKYFR